MKYNTVSLIAGTVSVLTVLSLPISALAATTPSLGAAATYGILSSTYTNTSAGTTINGDVGFTTGPAVAPLGTHVNYGSGAPYAAAGTDQGSAAAALASQACTFTFAGGAVNLSTDTTHGTIGVYAPGVYCASGAMDVGGPLTLSGTGTYIFRSTGALTTTAGANVTLSDASACDVFWTPSAATTLAANTTFAGTVLSDAGITIGANTVWVGRALSFGGTNTTDTTTITVPNCAAPVPPAQATLRIVKEVVNTGGGVALPSLFNLHVKLSGTEVSASPATGVSFPGRSYALTPGTYVVSEDVNSSYVQSFSGACNASGSVTLSANIDVTCTVTNTYIPPAPVTPVATTTTTIIPAPVVVVAPVPAVIPSLPNTGLPPQESPWNTALFGGILMAALVSLAVVTSKRKV